MGKSTKKNNFFKSVLLNYIATAVGIVINLLLIPLLLLVLGKEKFGIWQTILSIISVVSLLNFGLGNGLRNLITKLKVQQSNSDIPEDYIIGSAIGATFKKITTIIIVSFLILIPLVYYFIEPDKIFVNTTIADYEIRISIIIFLSFFLFNIVLNLSNSIAFGLQKSYLTGLTQVTYLLLSYSIIYVLSLFIEINLIYCSLIIGLSQSLSYLFFLLYQNKKFKLKINFRATFDLKETTSLSFNFFLVQALALIFLSVDNFVISSILGPNETAEFSVVNKIYFTLISLFSVLLIHFWNSVTEAFEEKNMQWIFSILKILYFICALVFFAGIGIAFFQEEILNLWLGKSTFKIESLTFYLFSIYTLFHCLNAIFVNIQNGLGFLRIQIFSMVLALLLYGLGCYIIDIKYYGYNVIVALKIGVMLISLLINSTILIKMKKI